MRKRHLTSEVRVFICSWSMLLLAERRCVCIGIHNEVTSEQRWALIALQFATSSEGFSKQGTGMFTGAWFAFVLPLYFDYLNPF